MENNLATFDDFAKLDVRVGTIISAQKFPEARKPAYKLEIDFGSEIGVKKSSAQITNFYESGELVGRKIIGIVKMNNSFIMCFNNLFWKQEFPTKTDWQIFQRSLSFGNVLKRRRIAVITRCSCFERRQNWLIQADSKRATPRNFPRSCSDFHAKYRISWTRSQNPRLSRELSHRRQRLCKFCHA